MKNVCFLFLAFLAMPVSRTWAQQKITSTRYEVTSRLDATPSEAARRVVEPYKASVDSVMAPVLGESLVGMSAGRPESLLGNWGADVMVEFSDFDGGQRADLGIINVGGLRNNMPKGVVRKGDIMLISPFQNKLAVAYLRGTDLLTLFQDIAAVHGEAVSREVRLVITEDGRLLDAKVGGQPVDPERTYRVATLDYLAEGNDRLFSFKKAQDMHVSDFFTRDVMMESVRRAGKINAAIEGRITVKE